MRSSLSHRLPRVAGSIPGDQGLAGGHSSSSARQHYSSELHHSEGGATTKLLCQLAILLWTSMLQDNSDSRALIRPSKFTGRQGVQDHEGSLRLDVQQNNFSANRDSDGTTQDRSLIDKATSLYLQLEAKSRSSSHGCLPAGLVDRQGLCQPSVVFDTMLPDQDQSINGMTSPTPRNS